jgi:hypothetical protein
MESSPKEQDNGCQHNPNKQETNSDTDVSHDSQSSEFSQLELMSQWRCNLNNLLEDLGIPACDSVTANESQDITPEIAEKLDYLKKTDVLLQQYDDFALSGAGFEKYKAAHLSVVNFLIQLYRQKEKQKEEKEREQKKEKKAVKFYFFSRAKHIQQQAETIPWSFAVFHLVLLLIATAALAIGGTLVTVSTQNNGIVRVLLVITVLAVIRATKKKIRNHRESALTPVRFITSLLSICSLSTVLYALLFIVIPVLCVWKIEPFWCDDVIIIGLGVFSLIIFSHSQGSGEDAAQLNDPNHANKESEDALNAVDTEVTK